MGQQGRRAGKVVVSALIGASIRLSFRGVCRWRVAEDGRRWPAVIRSDAYLFDILRSEMRFFPGELRISHSLSLSPFSNFLFFPPVASRFSLLSMKLATNYGSWPLEKIPPLLSTRISLPRSKGERSFHWL